MSMLYVTSDRIGQANHGGGSVTGNELLALQSLGGSCEVWGQSQFQSAKVAGTFLSTEEAEEPWYDDAIAVQWTKDKRHRLNYDLAHFYAGTFTRTIAELNRQGCITSYTTAAHDKDLSRQEHERLGLPFPYPHLTEPELWQRYLQGYLDADLLIVPSQLSKRVCSRRV